MRAQIWNAVAVVLSAVLASVAVVYLPQNSEAAEFLVWLVFFAASSWLLDRVMGRRFRQPPRG